jgi:hypothetical protein
MESASTTKVLIPTAPYLGAAFIDQSLDLIQLRTAESGTSLETYRVEPELGFRVIALNMDVTRFVPVAGIEEGTVRPDLHDSRHDQDPSGTGKLQLPAGFCNGV